MNRKCIFVCLFLAACSSPTYRFKVTGVEGEFCVPKTGFVAPGVWFAPKDASGAPKGFSFGGCHRLAKETDRASCAMPDNFVSADVISLSQYRDGRWEALKSGGLYEQQASQSGAEYDIDDATGALVLFNPNVWPSWSVWRRSSGHEVVEALAMRDDDELIAACSKVEDYPGTDGLGNKGEYGCDRFVRGDRYALNYRFISKQRVPTETQMKALESALFDQVDRWQCSK